MNKQLLISLFCLLALGCSDKPSELNQEYQQRLLNTLELEHQPSANLSNPTLEKVPLPESDITISVLDIASLGHCKVTNLIAQHNNQLGKVSYPSERLKYHIRFIQLAPACADHPKTSEKVAAALTTAVTEKTAQLPHYFMHMMSFERELQVLGVLTRDEVPIDNVSLHGKTLEAIEQLAEMASHLEEPQKLDPEALTPALEVLSQRYIPSLLSSVRKQSQYNRTTTTMLEQVALEQTLCQPQGNRERAEILNNVFSKFYLKQLQPYQASLTNLLAEVEMAWLPIAQLYHEQGVTPPIAPTKHLNELKQSAKAHVTWWQKFYKLCEITPL